MLLLTVLSSFYTRVDFGRREKKSHRNSATFCSCTSDTQEENISPFSVHMKITFLCPFFANATHSLTNLYLPWKRAQGDDKKRKKKRSYNRGGPRWGFPSLFLPQRLAARTHLLCGERLLSLQSSRVANGGSRKPTRSLQTDHQAVFTHRRLIFKSYSFAVSSTAALISINKEASSNNILQNFYMH